MPPPFPTDYHWSPGPNPVAPARRAGVLLIIIGSMSVLFGFCVGAVFMIVPIEQLLAQGGLPPEAMNGVSPQQMKVQMMVMSVVLLILGAVGIAIGTVVRRGSRGAIIAGIVLSGIVVLFGALQVLGGVLMAALHPNPATMLGVCMITVPLALLLLAIVWLVQALRGANQAMVMQQQYMAQLWQSQQQQGYYAPPGYGYAQPPPPPPAYAAPPVPPAQPWMPPAGPVSFPEANSSQEPRPELRHPPLPPDATRDEPKDGGNH